MLHQSHESYETSISSNSSFPPFSCSTLPLADVLPLFLCVRSCLCKSIAGDVRRAESGEIPPVICAINFLTSCKEDFYLEFSLWKRSNPRGHNQCNSAGGICIQYGKGLTCILLDVIGF